MRTRKTVVILISGKAGSGKTTIANILKDKILEIPSMTVLKYGFADPIKYIARAFAKWDENKDEKGRRLLQQIGAIFREYNQDIWVIHFLNQLDKKAGILPFNFAIIDDWRFPNELAYLKQNPILDIVTIRIFGRGGLSGSNASDVSENSLPEVSVEMIPTGLTDDHWYDFQIENSDDLEQLEKKMDLVLSSLEKQYIV